MYHVGDKFILDQQKASDYIGNQSKQIGENIIEIFDVCMEELENYYLIKWGNPIKDEIWIYERFINTCCKQINKCDIETFEDYQSKAWKTAIFPNAGKDLVYPMVKLAGECGEVLEKYGKLIRDKGGDIENMEFKEGIAKELGDVLWYIAAIATTLDLPLKEIAQANIDKLYDRLARNKIKGEGDER